MICRYDQLRRHPTVFLKMTGLRVKDLPYKNGRIVR